MLALVIALSIFLVYTTTQWVLNYRSKNLTESQARSYLVELQEAELNYQALEVGRDEETEAHEMELASLMEAYHKLNDQHNLVISLMTTQTEIIADLQEITNFHDANCLLHLDRDRDTLTALSQKRAHLNQELLDRMSAESGLLTNP